MEGDFLVDITWYKWYNRKKWWLVDDSFGDCANQYFLGGIFTKTIRGVCLSTDQGFWTLPLYDPDFSRYGKDFMLETGIVAARTIEDQLWNHVALSVLIWPRALLQKIHLKFENIIWGFLKMGDSQNHGFRYWNDLSLDCLGVPPHLGNLHFINGNFRILKWRYCTLYHIRPYFVGIFSYIGLI